MRLKNIKLAGFKSFADATTVEFPSQLIAVVGPNGCGKSNIIDAVRWVMGESSAKQLRGDSMTDVIFNGAASRPPAGLASIELQFENTEGKLGGQYAAYQNIAIRREVNREGQSQYYFNGAKCRRRDITDVFLGTGLGPRSYAIIRQDTVSRLIEAKPEELRIFLEEAAGISKYKERRKETELRIKHTRENLSRVLDIQEELQKQLVHLERQAKAAERYKVLKAEQRTTRSQVFALQWQQLQIEKGEFEQQVARRENALQAAIADLRKNDSEHETVRDQHHAANEHYNHCQGEYYALGATVGQLEQRLSHKRERVTDMQQEREQLEQELAELTHSLETTQTELSRLSRSVSEQTGPLAEAEVAQTQAQASLDSAEQRLASWQSEWDGFASEHAHRSEAAQVAKTKVTMLEQSILDARAGLEKLSTQVNAVETQSITDTIVAHNQALSEAEVKLVTEQTQLEVLRLEITSQREHNKTLQQALSGLRTNYQKALGQQASLQALQDAALGKDSKRLNEWLSTHGLANVKRLAQAITVSDGWERAAESVLDQFLQALCVEDMASLVTTLQDLPQGALSAVSVTQQANLTAENPHGTQRLLAFVTTDLPLQGLLANVYVAEDLAAARTLLAALPETAMVVTRDGHRLGQHWLQIANGADQNESILAREQNLKALSETIDGLQTEITEHEQALEQAAAKLNECETASQAQQRSVNEVTAQVSEIQAKLRVQQARLQSEEKRLQRLVEEQSGLAAKLADLETQSDSLRQQWEDAVSVLAQDSSHREQLQASGEQSRQAVTQARQTWQQVHQQLRDMSLALQQAQQRVNTLTADEARLTQQLAKLRAKHQAVQASLAENDAPIVDLQEKLARTMDEQAAMSTQLQAVGQALEQLDARMRGLVTARSGAEQQVNHEREALQAVQLKAQAAVVKSQGLLEQLAEVTDEPISDVVQLLPAEARLAVWQDNLALIEKRIQRLGAINLAAIDEFKTLAERKTYLDEQQADLNTALETLEGVMRKIDQETRSRFKATLASVDNDFQRLFPKIFGGGQAYLKLTEEDLLNAGVMVHAQPPGKKNATIHLLSGGEKALTAIALVFAIFQLNPAPFCMLDEVDAPLDDANVMRFTQLVKEMSAQTQFIFITHNKVTMELANQLMGVTMNEPGVSRLVSVDVEDALAMAEA